MAILQSSLKRKGAPKSSSLETTKNPRKVQKISKAQHIDSFTSRNPVNDIEDSISSKTKSTKVTKLADSPASDENEDVEEEEVADQTAALLKGFESSEEEKEDDEEEGESDESEEEDENSKKARGINVPSIPSSKALKKKLAAAAKTASANAPGVIYVGHIPHGFYEYQMRAYFSQFGDITRLRLSRNRRTGASKHYAFIEFASGEVADIVARTMDNYLMFGHILKVKLLAPEQVHEELFKGANKRFKKIPWNKLDRWARNNVDRQMWEKRLENEKDRRAKKEEALKELGYEFKAPVLREVADVPVQKQIEAQLATSEAAVIPALPSVVEESEQIMVSEDGEQTKITKKLVTKTKTKTKHKK